MVYASRFKAQKTHPTAASPARLLTFVPMLLRPQQDGVVRLVECHRRLTRASNWREPHLYFVFLRAPDGRRAAGGYAGRAFDLHYPTYEAERVSLSMRGTGPHDFGS